MPPLQNPSLFCPSSLLRGVPSNSIAITTVFVDSLIYAHEKDTPSSFRSSPSFPNFANGFGRFWPFCYLVSSFPPQRSFRLIFVGGYLIRASVPVSEQLEGTLESPPGHLIKLPWLVASLVCKRDHFSAIIALVLSF